MKLFISESVCGGGWTEQELPPSLAAEGGAMLRALCEDAAILPDVSVTTTLDARCTLDLPKSVEVIHVASVVDEWDCFLERSTTADRAIVISPELQNTLATRVGAARANGAKVLAPPTEVIELCSDKLRLARFLTKHGIPTIETVSLVDGPPLLPSGGQVVIKPRFGAGSQGIRTVDVRSLHAHVTPQPATPVTEQIVQPLIFGEAFSIGTLCRLPTFCSNSTGDILHLARQVLSPDGRFEYLAGSLPSHSRASNEMMLIVDACQSLLPDLAGYVGFDFVVPDSSPTEPLLVEINPRFCTSYLGYRMTAGENLVERILNRRSLARLTWSSRSVTYFPNGNVCTPGDPKET